MHCILLLPHTKTLFSNRSYVQFTYIVSWSAAQPTMGTLLNFKTNNRMIFLGLYVLFILYISADYVTRYQQYLL